MKPDLRALEMEVMKMKPRLELYEDMLKEVKDWEVGKTYTITLKVKQVSKEEELGEPVEACFEVLSAKAGGLEGKDAVEEEVKYINKVI